MVAANRPATVALIVTDDHPTKAYIPLVWYRMVVLGKKIVTNFDICKRYCLPSMFENSAAFYDRTEAAMYFRDKSVKKEEEIEMLRLEFDDRAKQVGHATFAPFN